MDIWSHFIADMDTQLKNIYVQYLRRKDGGYCNIGYRMVDMVDKMVDIGI